MQLGDIVIWGGKIIDIKYLMISCDETIRLYASSENNMIVIYSPGYYIKDWLYEMSNIIGMLNYLLT